MRETIKNNKVSLPKRGKRGRRKKSKIQFVNVAPSVKLLPNPENSKTVQARNASMADSLVTGELPRTVIVEEVDGLQRHFFTNAKPVCELLKKFDKGDSERYSNHLVTYLAECIQNLSLESSTHGSSCDSINTAITASSAMGESINHSSQQICDLCGNDINLQGLSPAHLLSQSHMMDMSTAIPQVQGSRICYVSDRLRENNMVGFLPCGSQELHETQRRDTEHITLTLRREEAGWGVKDIGIPLARRGTERYMDPPEFEDNTPASKLSECDVTLNRIAAKANTKSHEASRFAVSSKRLVSNLDHVKLTLTCKKGIWSIDDTCVSPDSPKLVQQNSPSTSESSDQKCEALLTANSTLAVVEMSQTSECITPPSLTENYVKLTFVKKNSIWTIKDAPFSSASLITEKTTEAYLQDNYSSCTLAPNSSGASQEGPYTTPSQVMQNVELTLTGGMAVWHVRDVPFPPDNLILGQCIDLILHDNVFTRESTKSLVVDPTEILTEVLDTTPVTITQSPELTLSRRHSLWSIMDTPIPPNKLPIEKHMGPKPHGSVLTPKVGNPTYDFSSTMDSAETSAEALETILADREAPRFHNVKLTLTCEKAVWIIEDTTMPYGTLVSEQCIELIFHKALQTVDPANIVSDTQESKGCLATREMTDIEDLKLTLIRNDSVWRIKNTPFLPSNLLTEQHVETDFRASTPTAELSEQICDILPIEETNETHGEALETSLANSAQDVPNFYQVKLRQTYGKAVWSIEESPRPPDNLVGEQCIELVLQENCHRNSEFPKPTWQISPTSDSADLGSDVRNSKELLAIKEFTHTGGVKWTRKDSAWNTKNTPLFPGNLFTEQHGEVVLQGSTPTIEVPEPICDISTAIETNLANSGKGVPNFYQVKLRQTCGKAVWSIGETQRPPDNVVREQCIELVLQEGCHRDSVPSPVVLDIPKGVQADMDLAGASIKLAGEQMMNQIPKATDVASTKSADLELADGVTMDGVSGPACESTLSTDPAVAHVKQGSGTVINLQGLNFKLMRLTQKDSIWSLEEMPCHISDLAIEYFKNLLIQSKVGKLARAVQANEEPAEGADGLTMHKKNQIPEHTQNRTSSSIEALVDSAPTNAVYEPACQVTSQGVPTEASDRVRKLQGLIWNTRGIHLASSVEPVFPDDVPTYEVPEIACEVTLTTNDVSTSDVPKMSCGVRLTTKEALTYEVPEKAYEVTWNTVAVSTNEVPEIAYEVTLNTEDVPTYEVPEIACEVTLSTDGVPKDEVPEIACEATSTIELDDDPIKVAEGLEPQFEHIMATQLYQRFEEKGPEMNAEIDRDTLEQGAMLTVNLLAALKHVNLKIMKMRDHNGLLYSSRHSGCQSRYNEHPGLLHGTQTTGPVSRHLRQKKPHLGQLTHRQRQLLHPASHQYSHRRTSSQNDQKSSASLPLSLSLGSNTPQPLVQDSSEAPIVAVKTTITNVVPKSKNCRRARLKNRKIRVVNRSTKSGLRHEYLHSRLTTEEPVRKDIMNRMFKSAARALEMSVLDNGKTISEILDELDNDVYNQPNVASSLIVANRSHVSKYITEPSAIDLNVQGLSSACLPRKLSTDESHSIRTPDLLDRLKENLPEEIPDCNCPTVKKLAGPYYTHLGAARDVKGIRQLMEGRSGLKGSAIHIENVCSVREEGRGLHGCPIAKWIIRRSSIEEKLLIVCRRRPGHRCQTAVLIISIVVWEGVPEGEATELYNFMTDSLAREGLETHRRCALNAKRTCACQGVGDESGVSYSFGCCVSRYWDTCKYAKTAHTRKFKLKTESHEPALEEKVVGLATQLNPVLQSLAPDSFHNMTYFGEEAQCCRLGERGDQPFSGVTVCMDFCAHAHVDRSDMFNGCTMVVTLTKHRGLGPACDEQLHVLPHNVLDPTDEYGQSQTHNRNVEILNNYTQTLRRRAHPLPTVKKRMATQRSPPIISQFITDNPHAFRRARVGGVAMALSHGSVLLEVARRERHATTALKKPNRAKPTRIALVFYQHRNLNLRDHGKAEYDGKAQVWRAREQARKAKTLQKQIMVDHAYMERPSLQKGNGPAACASIRL